MDFQIDETIAEMAKAIKGEVGDDWNSISTVANSLFADKKSRMELIADLRIKNQLSDEDFKERLEIEKEILQSELHAMAIITKAIAQRAANAAIDVLSNAVKAIVDTAL